MFLLTILFLSLSHCVYETAALLCYDGNLTVNASTDVRLLYKYRNSSMLNLTDVCYAYREQHYDNSSSSDIFTFGFDTYQPLNVTYNTVCAKIGSMHCINETQNGRLRQIYCCNTDYCNAANISLPLVSNQSCPVVTGNVSATTMPTALTTGKGGYRFNPNIQLEGAFLILSFLACAAFG
uniref:Uncharacterized protein n=1 Tax=Plectus sambesii TaxID=2011161 RepID=A0A914WMF8_9BILA